MTILTILTEVGLAFDPTGLSALDSPDVELLLSTETQVSILKANGYIETVIGEGLLQATGTITGFELVSSADQSTVFTITDMALPIQDWADSGVDFVYLALQGSEQMRGSPAPDRSFGFTGADTLWGQGGGDILYGNAGQDIIYGNQGADFLFGGRDTDTLFGGQDNDVVYGNLEADTVFGNLQDDILFGGQGNDVLYGGQDQDTLFGNRDDDWLFGNLGDDVLIGGAGADTLVGGAGSDAYLFESNDGNDVIVDFDPAVDVIAIQETPSLFVDIAGGTVIEFGATQIYVLGVTADLVEARLTFL